jgi:hypothetical protein
MPIRLPALVAEYAEFDGRDSEILTYVARVIREAGLIPTGKAGWGAPTMSEREVTNLLLGANGADAPAEAARAVVRLRALPLRIPAGGQFDPFVVGEPLAPRELWDRHWRDSPWRALAAIERLGDALDWIVRNAEAIERAIVVGLRPDVAATLLTMDAGDAEERRAVEAGESETLAEIAGDWRRFVAATLTIGDAEASFEIASTVSHPRFPGIRLDYCHAPDAKHAEELPAGNRWRPRRRLVEVDFAAILAFSRLVGCQADRDATAPPATTQKRCARPRKGEA